MGWKSTSAETTAAKTRPGGGATPPKTVSAAIHGKTEELCLYQNICYYQGGVPYPQQPILSQGGINGAHCVIKN